MADLERIGATVTLYGKDSIALKGVKDKGLIEAYLKGNELEYDEAYDEADECIYLILNAKPKKLMRLMCDLSVFMNLLIE